jgi:hypothetical protein
MGMKTLSLDTLPELDGGKPAAALEVHLKRAVADCYDRPGDDKARSVTMQFDLEPVMETDGSCKEVKLRVQVTSKVPAHRTRMLSMALFPSGKLGFNPDSLESDEE